MSIDKSIRQWYASGQLVKKGPVGTRPGFRGPHGSGPGAPSRSAPSGPSRSAPSGPSGPSGPPGGGGGHHAPSPRPAPAPAPSPHRDPTPTRAPDFVTGGSKPSPTTTPSPSKGDAPGREFAIATQYTPTAAVDFDDYNYPGIDTDFDKPTRNIHFDTPEILEEQKKLDIQQLIAKQQEEKFGDTADPTKFGETISPIDKVMSKPESEWTTDDKLEIEKWEKDQDWDKVKELSDKGHSFDDIQKAMDKGLLLKQDAIRRQGLIERGLAAIKPETKLESSLIDTVKKTFDPKRLATNYALRKMGLSWLNPLMGLASLFGLPQKAKSMIAKKPAFDPKKAGQLGLYADRFPTGTTQYAKARDRFTPQPVRDIVAGTKGILESGQELLGLKDIEGQQAKVVGPALIQMRVLEKKKGMSEVGGPELTPDEERKLDKLKEMDKEETIYRKAIAAHGGRIDKPLTGRSRDI